MMQLEATLQDKEWAIAEAIDDVTKTSEDLTRIRAENRRQEQEVADLQGKKEELEKEVIILRKQLIKMMEDKPEGVKPEGLPMEPARGEEP
jgi:hypothetical protein